MHIFNFGLYTLILSHNPCDIFKCYQVSEMHGLNLADCEKYNNTTEDAYIAGLCNLSPKDNKPFVFINLSRCINDIKTTGLVFHEMMHLAGIKYEGCWDSDEENMITFAENETYKVVELIKNK
jgi:hypothetical protein